MFGIQTQREKQKAQKYFLGFLYNFMVNLTTKKVETLLDEDVLERITDVPARAITPRPTGPGILDGHAGRMIRDEAYQRQPLTPILRRPFARLSV